MTINSNTLPGDLARGLVSLEDVICRLADANNAVALGELIGPRVALNRETVVGILTAAGEGPVALMVRTAGLSCNAYSAVLRFRHRLLRKTAASPAALLAAYPKLPRPSPSELCATLAAFGALQE